MRLKSFKSIKELTSIFKDNPINFFEIGGRNTKSQSDEFINYLAFEPDELAYKSLQDYSNITLFNTALGDGEVHDFYALKHPGCSSILYPNFDEINKYKGKRIGDKINWNEYFEIKEKSKIRTKTLQEIIKENNIKSCDVIKIDIQGFELEVIKNSIDLFKNNVFLIEIELSVIRAYHNQPNYFQLIELLTDLGFKLVTIKNIQNISRELTNDLNFIDSGEICQFDGIFIKNIDNIDLNYNNRFQIYKYIYILYTYNFYSLALYLSRIYLENQHVNDKIINKIMSIILTNYKKKNKLMKLSNYFKSFLNLFLKLN